MLTRTVRGRLQLANDGSSVRLTWNRMEGYVSKNNGATLGFEETLWQAADKMRGHMDPSEYKHVALGLIFLKYISDAFEERREAIRAELTDPDSAWHTADPGHLERELEDRDAYAMKNVFWVPKEARWPFLQDRAKQPGIGKLIDDAMVAIEKENPSLKGVLPKDYARPALDKQRLGASLKDRLQARRNTSSIQLFAD